MKTAPLPPGPPPSQVPSFWAEYLADPWRAIRGLLAEYGPVARLPGPGGRHLTFVMRPEDNLFVLMKGRQHFAVRGAFCYLDDVAPDVLLSQDGEHAMRVRRLLLPSLHRRRIPEYFDQMAALMLDRLESWPSDDPRDVADLLREMTFDISTQILLGVDSADHRLQELKEAFGIMAEYAAPLPSELKGAMRPRFESAKLTAARFIDELIEQRRVRDLGDALSLLVQARDDDGAALTQAELRDNAWGLVFASHDTAANALAWAMWLLGHYHDVRDRLRGEMGEVVGGDVPTLDEIGRLEGVNHVVREVLRLYPSAPAIPRVALDDTVLGGHLVPAGDMVVCALIVTHRIPDVYPDPDRFDPDRWAPERQPDPPKGAYLPFGIGPRWCPGEPFALLEMSTFLALALSRIDFDPLPDQEVIAYAAPPAMRPVPGMRMWVTRRQPGRDPDRSS